MYLYFIHSSTTSVLSKTIGLYTRSKYNHVSIGFDQSLNEVYSFGRKVITNPLVGGFVMEDLSAGLFTEASCSIYRLAVTEEEYFSIREMIRGFENRREQLKYNFLGLFFLSLGVNIKRVDYYFCSEFASTVIQKGTNIQLPKQVNFMKPQDLAELPEMEFMYEGRIANYQELNELAEYGYPVEWSERKKQLVV